ncbi:unnamed protein product [Urochloa humidicola]
MPKQKKIHFVGLAAVCWAIWNARNKMCFESKRINSPTEIVCSIASFVSYWAGLHKQEDKTCLEAGAEALKAIALHFHPKSAAQEDTGLVLLQ